MNNFLQSVSMEDRIKVNVLCMTFNHSAFINETLNGFVMQRTDFPYLCIVMDDASTDGEQRVIDSYMNLEFDMKGARRYEDDEVAIVCARHKTNRECRFVVYFLKENHYRKKDKKRFYGCLLERSEYIASCEGDDYWTDPNKLQRQVDFLDSHPDYSMCSHTVGEYVQVTQTLTHRSYDSDIEYSLIDVASGKHYFQTLSMLYRNGIITDELRSKNRVWQDVVLVYNLLKQGKGICFKEEMGVYRVHSGGVWSGVSQETKWEWDFKLRQSIYDAEQTTISALGLVFCFTRILSRKWILQNWGLVFDALKTISIEFGIPASIKILCNKFFAGENVKMDQFIMTHRMKIAS